MRLSLAVTIALLGAACGGDPIGPVPSQSHVLSVAPNDSHADGVVRGTILGVRLTDPADTTSQEHVAGASIAVYLEFAHVPVDSSELPQHKLLGTITSDAQGAFQLTNVPDGYYRLDVTPPPGSPYAPGTSGTVSFTANTQAAALVWLYLK